MLLGDYENKSPLQNLSRPPQIRDADLDLVANEVQIMSDNGAYLEEEKKEEVKDELTSGGLGRQLETIGGRNENLNGLKGAFVATTINKTERTDVNVKETNHKIERDGSPEKIETNP